MTFVSSATLSGGLDDQATAIARGANGSLYVVGYSSQTGQGKNIWVSRWSESALAVISSVTFNGSANGNDAAQAVAVAPSGDVFVMGISSASGQGPSLWLGRFTASLAFVSSTTLPIFINNSPTYRKSLLVAPNGNLILASDVAMPGSGQNRILLAEVSPALAVVSSTTFFNGFNGNFGWSVARDQAGALYVAGSVAPLALTSPDIWVGKFGANLTFITSATVAGAGGNTDEVRDIAVGADGNVYVSGFINNGGGVVDHWLGKYYPDLTLAASQSTPAQATFNAYADSLVTSLNRIYTVGVVEESGQGGNAWINEYDYSFTMLSSASFTTAGAVNDESWDLAVDTRTGSAYVAGMVTSGFPRIWVAKYHLPDNGFNNVEVTAVSTAPASVDGSASYVPVIYADLTSLPGPTSMGTFTLNLYGDVPSSQFYATMWRDNGDGSFNQGNDSFVNSGSFAPPAAGLPARAFLSASGEPSLSTATQRYWFVVNFSSVPSGRKVQFGFQMPADFAASPNNLQFPFFSNPVLVRQRVFANPSNGVQNYPTPTAGSSNTGGLDTGIYVQSGQRVHSETAPGDAWNVPGSVSAAGSAPTGGLNAGFNRGLLVGRVGAGAWFPIGTASTITATSAGTLFVAPNDTVYSDNSGFVRATFEILPSTTPKIWLGGTLGFETSADIGANWAGGRPFNGESAVFDSSAYDCDWNLPFVTLTSLSVSTAYVKAIRLVSPPYQYNNRLQVEGDATIRGGQFSVGVASAAQTNSFAVKGRLVVRDTATLDMTNGRLELGVGMEVRAGALLRASGNFQVWRAVPSLPWYLRVDQATVNVTAWPTNFDGADYIDLINPTVLAFDGVSFTGGFGSTSPYVRLAASSPAAYTFNKWDSGSAPRNPGVVAADVVAGSTIIFNDSVGLAGTSFGSPKTQDPNGVVRWIPDGGGSPTSISGTLTGPGGSYTVMASTSPTGPSSTGLGGGGSILTSPGAYSVTSLRAPGTYYLFAYQESGGNRVPFTPTGGFGHDGLFRSEPVFLPSGVPVSGIDITAADWGEVGGSFNNQSNQAGPIIVETWKGQPNLSVSTRQARGMANPGYSILTPSTNAVTVFAFVDANNSGAWDVFEASTAVTGVTVGNVSQTYVGNFSIFGGDAAPGGSVTLSTQAVHLGAVGTMVTNPMIRARLTASVGAAQFSALRATYQGGPFPTGGGISVWADDGDGIFNTMYDMPRGYGSVFSNGPSTVTVSFYQPVFLPSGVPKDFFIALELGGSPLGPGATAGVLIEAATGFTLSMGTFSVTPNFPVQTGALPVLTAVRANDTATPDLMGGVNTGAYLFPGQMVSVTSTGTWTTGPADAATGPGGAPGTTGLNTVLPSANRGELIGRVQAGANYSSPWVRIGASSAPFPSPGDGELRLAINDFVGAYYDNQGAILAGFSASGSSVGAISGQVFYSTPVAGTLTVTARLNGSTPMQSTSFGVASSSSYPFIINNLVPGRYDLSVTHGSNGDFGRSGQEIQVQAGATSYLNAVMYQTTGSISGSIVYTGVMGQGDFQVGVATVTDFTGEVSFFGGYTNPAVGPYSFGMLPAPATYFLVAYRDGDWNGKPSGPEPLGYYGSAGGGLSTLPAFLTPIFVPGGNVGSINVTLQDTGAIDGMVTLTPGATGTVVIETGRGVPGSAGYATENRLIVPVPAGAVTTAGLPYSLGLLRPATGYSVFAFLDKNFDGQPSAGEEQMALVSAVSVPSGGRARLDFALNTLSAPAAPVSLVPTAAVGSVTFDWNLVPGATGYQLRRADNAVLFSLSGATSRYIDALPSNTSSQIRSITASNGNGTSAATALAQPAFTLAAIPGNPVPDPVTATGALVAWSGANPAGTVYEVMRSTVFAGSAARVHLGTATSVFNPLAPASTYFWTVRALNGNGLFSSFSGAGSTVTLPATGPSLSGLLNYAGAQTAGGRGFVLEASTSSTTFFPRASSAALPGALQQPWFLPVSAGTYFVRAFVDVAGNGVLQPGADRGVVGSSVVAGSPVTGVNFTVAVDTVPPGPPAGVVAVPGFNKVTLSWVPPTRNANGTTLVDLAGYAVFRATSPTAAFLSLTPALLSSGTASFVDNFPIPGIPNIYVVRSRDIGGNQSSPSGAVSGSPSAGGSISGQIRSFSVAAGGQYRVRLSTMPAPSAPSVAEAALTSYTFTGLADRTYYLRAFRDVNNNGVEDPLTEPAGTFGGLNQPFPIAIINGNAVSGADATICDRSPLQPPAVFGSLTTAGCPALDKGPGFVTSLYALSVGGGVAGSLGAGTQVNLAVSTATTFATDLILLGPAGNIVARDNRVGGANLTTTLTAPGIYLAELTSFQVGAVGSFGINMRLEGGFAGVIAGSVTYTGLRTGKVYTQLFNSPSPASVAIMTSTSNAALPLSFGFPGLPDGQYFLRGFRDSNNNGVRDLGEPSGQYGVSSSSPLPVAVVGGQAFGAPFTVALADPAVGTVRGAALYEGTVAGALRVEAGRPSCPMCSSIGEVIAFTTVAAGGVYTLPFLPSATDYVIRAFVDANGNGRSDALESSISTFPITVFVNATSTISLIVQDGGFGAAGTAIMVGTVSYSGTAAGPVIVGISRDPQFRSVDYLLTLPSTGYFEHSGLQGDTTYYMAGFIDSNLNNSPDQDLGEPANAGSESSFGGAVSFDNPPAIFVAASGATGVKLQLSDPPNGSAQGTVRYAGSASAPSLIVQAYPAEVAGFWKPVTTVVPRAVGVSTYAYTLSFLEGRGYNVSAFVDANGNGWHDFGEPFGSRPPVSISSGAGAFPSYGVNLEIFDPGILGANATAGRIHGELVYLGTQAGPVYVRFFNNPERLGAPLYTLRVPATGLPTPGSGEFDFDKPNLPFGEYYLDAFRDPSGSGVYNPAAHAFGVLNQGMPVSVSQQQPDRSVFGGSITDPGQGGSVNAFTGSFAAPGGARFDGGATDLGAIVAVDSAVANGPQPVLLGVTAQNGGVEAWGVRYSSTGVFLSSAVVGNQDLAIGQFAVNNGTVWMMGRIEFPGTNGSTATITEYDSAFVLQNYNEYPDYQGLDGLTYNGGSLFAASMYIPTREIRALKINPATLAITASASFANPGSCQYCYSQAQAATLSPDGQTMVVYASVNKDGDADRGLHFLLKFDAASMTLTGSKDVTSLGGPTRDGVSLALTNAGALYMAFATDGDTARTFKFDTSGSDIVQTGSAAYGPIQVHFSGGMGNLQLDPASGHPFEVWESTTGAGDYVLLRYDQSLNLVGQRFFDGFNNTLEDTGFSLAVYNSSTVFVTGAVNNGLNLDWGTVRLNGNGNGAVSAAGTPVSITTANAVNYISGTVSYGGSLVTSGTVRMSLTPLYTDVPIRFATAPFGGSSSFLFNNIPDGVYDVRAFVDPNGNFTPDEGEPIGASTLRGLDFYRQTGSQVLADPVQLCDRRQIAFGTDVVQSFGAADCTSPDRPGAPRRLYTFRGTRGQPVTIALKAIGFYDSYLDLYGPDGDWIDYDDDGGGNGDAQISNFVLPEDGVYTIDAGAYASGSFGQFKLSLSGSAGALGGISGVVNYAGSQGGAVVVGLFDSPAFSSSTSVGGLVLTSTRAFAFTDLPVGATYYLGAFIDVNANQVPDLGEDGGVFGLNGVPNPILLAAGQIASGVEIAVVPSTTAAASAAYVTGAVSYAGTRTGSLVLEFWSSAKFTGHPVASRVVPTGVGSYDVAVAGGLPYYVRAFIDANGDFALQPDEPRGVYGPAGQGAEQVYAPAGQTMVGIDLTIKDPGLTASGAISGEGTAVLSSTFAVSGQQATVIVTYTAGANGVSGGATGGQIGFTAPPGFPFPYNSPSGSSVTVKSAFTGFGAVTYAGPSAFVKLTGAGLAAGQTLTMEWSNVYMACQIGVATVTVSSLKTTAVATDVPQPLLLGSPSLAVVPGAARFVQLDAPYFSVKQGELSDVRRLETRDMCGSRAPVTAPLVVDLRSARFNGSAFVPDAEVGVATSPALSTEAAVAVDFAVGESSKSFYVLAASTGFKSLELHYNLIFDTTFYFGVSAMPADALTGVSVSTASNGVALSSAAIGLGANGQPNQVFLNFTLGDPNQPWHVIVSSLPFKAGELPAAVWERWGYGQPSKGEIAWDGRYSPWINGGVRVPNGLYYVRVEVGGGGGVKDDTIRVNISLPQFAGRAFDPGTVPNPPLSGVNLRVYGPAGYFTATTLADGSYVLPGLGAGAYRMNVGRPDYVDGAIDLTLNASGAATSFVSRTAGLLVSSNASGGLDLFVSRAPRLIVVPSMDPSVAAAANDQWGSLQIRPSTAAAQQASTIYGPMRLKGGTTTFDDGGQWDSATQQFIAKTLLGFNVPVGTYTVLGDLSGYSRSTGTVYVGSDGARLDLTPFLPKAVITGQVGLGVGNPAPAPYGLGVGISAVALSTDIASSNLSGGTFIPAGSTYAVYSISGFDPGGYLLRANTQGLSAVTTGPLVVSGTATLTGIDFPDFGAGASISGTISVVAPNGSRIWVNAWSPGSFNFGSTQVFVNANSAAYVLPGLDAGATYQLYANIDGQGTDYDLTVPAGGFPIRVLPPATQNFTLSAASGVVSGTIILRAGTSDFMNVTLNGRTIASLKPERVGESFVEVSTTLPNFSCGGLPAANPSSVPVGGFCLGTGSSATFKVQGVNTETLDIRFLHSTTGQSSRQTLSIVNGSTATLIADLSASTFSISGFLVNQIADTLFNTNAKILANAPFVAPLGYPAGLSSTTARVTAVRQEIDSYGTAISTVFNPVSSRVGFLDASGAFTIPNIPNGVYIVRTTDLRSCSTCAVIAPSVGRTVTVSGADVSSVTLTVSNGYNVSGTISLDGGLLDARVFRIDVLNKRQEVVRSTVAYLGDLNLGAMAGSVDYSFTNLPAGEFYTLSVRGTLFPIKYAGRPVKFPDPALSPTGLQSNLTGQNVLMQRAAYIVGRIKDGATGELVSATNATLLAPNFAISATANPWTEGGFVTAASSISARPIEGDGYFRVGPLVPDVSYDLRLAQATWDPNFLASGSQNYAPVTIGGLKPTPGEIRDVGIVALGQGQSVTGIVRSTTTGLALGNIKVTARPSFGSEDALVVQSFTNSLGAYSLWVSTAISNQFNLVVAPRDGNQASDGRYYGTVELTNLNLQTQTSANFLLTPLSVVVTGQIVVADAATGGALSYPFGDKRGFPAAAINLQPVGVVPENPLGDIEATTAEGGLFSIPGLSTGVYKLHATSLGYAVYNATVSVIGSSFSVFTGSNTPANPITLTRGATATGRILKSDGTSPNSSEVVGVAAANFGAGEFVVGSVETDAVAKTVNAYTISGFKPGISYNIVLLSGSNGQEVSFPAEGAGVVFGAAESTTTKTINLTYRPARLDCLGTAKALDAARTRFLVQVDCLKPLRQETAADDDLTTILTASTFTAAGAALVAPNGTGILNNPSNSTSRRLLTATYTLAPSETRFSIRIRAFASEVDPTTGDNFAIDKVFDFYAGLDSSADGRATNINGGKVGMKPSAQDELLGLDERSGIDLPPGAFGEGSDSLADSGVVANPTTTVNVSMTKGRDQALAKALSVATLGYAPAALEVADVPSAFPAEMWAAMSTYRTQASTTQIGGANPISAFYSIFLPAGIRHQLKQRADLTLSYNTATSTGTTDDKIQVYFYNAVLGRFVPETVNRRLDTVNKTITVSVDHFSTFVVLDSTPVATSTVSFGGPDIAVANFPNPADCITHSNIVRNSTLFGSGGVHAPFTGTMIRTSIPLSGTPQDLKINIYTVTGEKIRTIEQGQVPAGQTYYTPWNCANDNGQTVASGVYIGEVIHGGRRKFFKIAIIKGSGL
ncbi:MAG: hypothetical protein HYX59_13780 [Elusimicrobia bacterium]|nr:hypothetical protein [Elusimicrobiota bacterium]